jgi:peptidoglycan/LPS O-acetylase OafA/YrhL
MKVESIDSRAWSNFLRFLAIMLVINSHLDDLYPIHWLGTGGSIGNSLFFMLSSYGIMLSEQKNPQSFSQFMIKRIKRIYPAVWINFLLVLCPVTLLYFFTSPYWYSLMVTELSLDQPLVVLGSIFYPPSVHWFLQALMLYYIAAFFFIKNYSVKKLFFGFLVFFTLYVFSYLRFTDYSSLVTESTLSFKLIFYGMIFLAGIFLSSKDDMIVYRGKSDFFILLILLALIYFHKLLMFKGLAGEYQFIEQLLIFPLLYYFIKVSKSSMVSLIMKTPVLSNLIALISAMTLELYIVHGPIRILIFQYFNVFPLNIILLLVISFLISYGCYRLNQIIVHRYYNNQNFSKN